MSNNTKYAQCYLEKKDGNSTTATVTYLPEKFAKKGMIVNLRNEDKTWDNGWTVDSVGHLIDEPPDVRASIKGHRKMTGDNLPKKTCQA